MSADYNDIQAQLDTLNRRRQLAEQLAQQTAQPEQQQVVGGRIMPQGFAPILRGITSLIAQGNANRASTGIQNLQQQQSGAIGKAIDDYQSAPPEGKAIALQRLQRLSNTPGSLAQSIIQQATAPKPPIIVPEKARVLDYQTHQPIPGAQPEPDEKPMDELSKLNSDLKKGLLTQQDYNSRKTLMTTRAPNAGMQAASALTDNALDIAAQRWGTKGELPAGAGRSPLMAAKIQNRWAEMSIANGDTAGAAAAKMAAGHSAQAALTQNAKLLASTTGYANTLDKNLTNLEQSYAKTDSSGSPLINKAARAWQQGISGDPQTAEMVTWLNAVQGEYAKLRSGSLGNAPASDAAMRDAKEVINKYMNQGGIKAVAAAIRQEKDNRLQSLQQESDLLTQQLGGSIPSPSQSPKETAAERAKRLGL